MMDKSLEQVCYDVISQANWSVRELRNIMQLKGYQTKRLQGMKYDDIFVKAFEYVYRFDYINRIFDKVIRKNENGKELVDKMFHSVFTGMRDLNEFYSYCFQLCQNSENLKDALPRGNISVSLIKYYAMESIEYKKIKQRSDLKRQEMAREKYKEYYEVIDLILNTKDEKVIISTLENFPHKIIYKNFYDVACLVYANVDYADLNRRLKAKMEIYEKYIYEKKRNARSINLINEFINSEYLDAASFCEFKKITYGRFLEYLRCACKVDADIYGRYQKKLLNVPNTEKEKLYQIVNYLKNGYEGRKFTIIDYFKITKLPLEIFYRIVKDKLTIDEYDIVRKFVNKYHRMTILSVKEIMNEKVEINCLKDKSGTPLPLTGHVVTDEEKEEIIQKIQSEGLYLYQNVYRYYLKEYFEDQNSSVLKKSL